MKSYEKGNYLFGTLTLDDLCVTLGQRQKCLISLFKTSALFRIVLIF